MSKQMDKLHRLGMTDELLRGGVEWEGPLTPAKGMGSFPSPLECGMASGRDSVFGYDGQQERTTQIGSMNETTQLVSRNETTQLCTAVDRLQPPTTTCNRLQPPATAYNRLQPPAPPLQQNRLFLPTNKY
ncbi:hypothetical protein TNCV_3767471 [Trichonephila clavipes]|nr:hypothetical protein TNCV_3767471 [Trichonephila clavipes]